MKSLLANTFLVILCAGKSTRMNSDEHPLGSDLRLDKALVIFKNIPWIAYQLKRANELGFQTIVVVTNTQNDFKVRSVIEDLKRRNYFRKNFRINVCCNSNEESQMFESMKIGFRAAIASKDAPPFQYVAFHTIDQIFPLKVDETAYFSDEALPEWLQLYHLQDGKNYHPVFILKSSAMRIFENASLPMRLDVRIAGLLGNPMRIGSKFPEGKLHFNTISEWNECQKTISEK